MDFVVQFGMAFLREKIFHGMIWKFISYKMEFYMFENGMNFLKRTEQKKIFWSSYADFWNEKKLDLLIFGMFLQRHA
ncbi:hypothetical protein [Butyrivibrio sp. NC3005]|uniref:hypothetical protein n=1 Tax=Butyrivibrio sp. NC3005 TaxID=1280685 RepID=UPI00047D0F5F|nr:hypothetical protein [Butyrivibrio sp. NC3005]